MKALSLHQPYASLIAARAKRFETRGWATSYRGPLVICAAKRKITGEALELFQVTGFNWALRSVASPPGSPVLSSELPLGVALCLADLTDCIPTEKLPLSKFAHERSFGNFAPGRFAWALEDIRPLPTPVPVRGRQGLFDLSAEEQRAVEQALGFVGVG